MRVGIIGLLQESNTFIDQATTIEHFRRDLLATGRDLVDAVAETHHELGGFLAGLDEAGLEAVPIFAARAMPFGVVTAEAVEQLLDLMLQQLDSAGPLDGLLVAPHGATVSAPYPDVDGRWLTLVRERVGPKLPVVCTLDPHANLTQAMIRACDATISYRTNPHLDQRQTGLAAAALMARILRGEVRPTQAAVMPPMAINIEAQRTALPPCRPLYELADAQLNRPGVLSNSIILGFPYADVAEMGSAVIVVTDNDRPLAERLAGELAEAMWSRRHELAGNLIGIEEALDRAAGLKGPICLLDMGDNIGGGAPGDSTHLVRAIFERRLPGAFAALYDPESVEQADAAGTGARLTLRVGGKTDNRHGEPIQAGFTVLGLYDGRFEESEPRHGGFCKFDQGRSAVVRTDDGLTLLLTSRRMVPFSLRQLTSCGLEPESFQLLVAKGVQAPAAAYEPVCRELIRVNTPGVTCADMTTLDYHHRRRPMFPFERETTWP